MMRDDILQERQKSILAALIQEYIRTARPVGSEELRGRSRMDAAPATIRNEMLKLDKLGYLEQPHTSAGRIPTDKGYRFFVDNLVADARLNKTEQKILEDVGDFNGEEHELIRELAKAVAHISGTFTAVGTFEDESLYEAGFSELFDEPEFLDPAHVKTFGRFADSVNEEIWDVFDDFDRDEERILIGDENPFQNGSAYAIMLSTWQHPHGTKGFITMVGPKRTNYAKHKAVLHTIKKIFDPD